MIYHTWTKALEANNAPILKSIDESVVTNEEAVVNVLFLVELSALNDTPPLGFSIMSKYTGIIGTETEKSRPLINNIVVIN